MPLQRLAYQARHQVAPRHARVNVRQQTLQPAQSLFALLVDGHLQGVAVGRHGAQRVAWWHHLGNGGGQQDGDLAGAHAGGLLDQLALALRVQQRSRRRRVGRQLRKRIMPGRFRRERSGRQRLRWSHDQHGHGRRRREIRRRQKLWSRAFVRGRRGRTGNGNGIAGGRRKRRGVSVQLRPRQLRAGMPGAGVLRDSVARHRRHARVHRRRITGALAGRRCKLRRRSGSALPLLTRFARRCRQPKLPGLTDLPVRCTALALGPLGAGKGGFQLRRRGHTQLATLQAGPHPPVAPAQPHRLDAPLRGGDGEAQLPHRVVEQAREPAPQRQTAAVDLVEMVQDVHFEAALIGGQTLGLLEELLIAQLAERSSASHAYHAVIINPVER